MSKETSNEPDSMCADISVHIQVCLKYFDALLKNFAATTPQPKSSSSRLKSAMCAIYQHAKIVLQNMLRNRDTQMILDSLQPDGHWMGNYASSENEAVRLGSNFLSASSMIQDLIIATSFMCTASLEAARNKHSLNHARPNKEQGKTNQNSILENWSLLFAPYWALASILTRMNASQEEDALLPQVRKALVTILKSPKTMNATPEYIEEIVLRTGQAAASQSTLLGKRLFNRLRRALKSHMRSVLLFGVFMALALHSDLSSAHARFNNPAITEALIEQSDQHSIQIIEIVVDCLPRLTFQTDAAGTEACPLTYCSAFRDGHQFKNQALQYNLALSLIKVLTKYGSSSIALADRLGMSSLHYAARKGHSVVLQYIVNHYPYCAAFKDVKGKLPLHHVLLNWRSHTTEAILELAEKVPLVLVNSPDFLPPAKANQVVPFKPLLYAQKNCPVPLYNSLVSIANAFTQSAVYSLACATATATAAAIASKYANDVTDGDADSSTAEENSSISVAQHSSSASSVDGEAEDGEEEGEEGALAQESRSNSVSTAEGQATAEVRAESKPNSNEQMLLLHFANSLLMLQSSSPTSSQTKTSSLTTEQTSKRKRDLLSTSTPTEHTTSNDDHLLMKRAKVC